MTIQVGKAHYTKGYFSKVAAPTGPTWGGRGHPSSQIPCGKWRLRACSPTLLWCTCCNSPLRRAELLCDVAVAPSLGGGLYAGTSPRLPGGPTHSAHTDRGKDVLRAGSNRGRSVAAILPPRGGLKTRCTAEANHAKFGLSGPHTVVLPELAESSNCILYNGLLGSRSCGRFLVSRGLAGPKCCSSTFARSRLPRTSFAKAVHGLNAAVPSCINGSGRWQLLPRPVVHTHWALLQPKLHALLPLGAAAAATDSAAGGLGLVL